MANRQKTSPTKDTYKRDPAYIALHDRDSNNNTNTNPINLVLTTESIIFGNEGGYGTVNRNDNGALSIGKLQWHGTRARNLLLKIYNKNKKLTLKYLQGTNLLNYDKNTNQYNGDIF